MEVLPVKPRFNLHPPLFYIACWEDGIDRGFDEYLQKEENSIYCKILHIPL